MDLSATTRVGPPPQQPWTPPPQTPIPKGLVVVVASIAAICFACTLISAMVPSEPPGAPPDAMARGVVPGGSTSPPAGSPATPTEGSGASAAPRMLGAGDAGPLPTPQTAASADAGVANNVLLRELIARTTQQAAADYVNVVQYDDELRGMGDQLRTASDPTLRRETRAALASVERRRRAIRREADATRRVEAERLAMSIICGDTPPMVSGWDGELIGSERFLQRTANDPDSIDVEHCTTPVLTRNRCWTSVCDVHGRNGFGAMIYNRMEFSVGRDHQILGARNVR